MARYLLIAVGITWLFLLVALSFAKTMGFGQQVWGSMEAFLGGNHQMHFLLASILSFLAHIVIYWRKTMPLFNTVTVILVLGCVADELIQLYFPTRHFSFWDMLASLAGVLVGYLAIAGMQLAFLKK